jgi:hypothetical protein
VRLRDAREETTAVFGEGSEIFVDVDVTVAESLDAIELLVRVRTVEEQLVCTGVPGKREERIPPGRYRATVRLHCGPLLPGVYGGDLVLLSHVPEDRVSPAFRFEIVSDPGRGADSRMLRYSASSGPESAHAGLGLVRIESSWDAFQGVKGE